MAVAVAFFAPFRLSLPAKPLPRPRTMHAPTALLPRLRSPVPARLLAMGLVVLALGGCVSKKKFEALQQRSARKQDSLQAIERKQAAQIDELSTALSDCDSALATHTAAEDSLRRALSRLQRRRESLQDELNALKNRSSQELRSLAERIEELRQELYTREQLLEQARSRLARRDSALQSLQNRLRKSLIALRDSGLSIHVEQGKVRVSLAERLLFKLGSTQIGAGGRSALSQLAGELRRRPGLQITVEGHTDSLKVVDLRCIDDNWELSALRAAEVVRYLTGEEQLAGARLTLAGRGPYGPVASNQTPEGRARNRRIEIYLAPDLQELYELLDLDPR